MAFQWIAIEAQYQALQRCVLDSVVDILFASQLALSSKAGQPALQLSRLLFQRQLSGVRFTHIAEITNCNVMPLKWPHSCIQLVRQFLSSLSLSPSFSLSPSPLSLLSLSLSSQFFFDGLNVIEHSNFSWGFYRNSRGMVRVNSNVSSPAVFCVCVFV